MAKHYWGYRIDTDSIPFFRRELEQGRLRQGWGWDKAQDLRNLSMDEGARRNLPIFNKVKKGDLLLVPRMPTWEHVAIVEAISDFCEGYRFEIGSDYNDYGHIFPAKLVKQFVRTNQNVPGKVRSTIKNISRFWNVDHCADDIEELIRISDDDLRDRQSYAARFTAAIFDSFSAAFDPKSFSQGIYKKLSEGFSNEEWEFALVEGLKAMFPTPVNVERTGGIKENMHGTDILIRIPGLLNYEYGIAIQVKDYSGAVNMDPVQQLAKADEYWNSEGLKIIDKILVITKADKEHNVDLLKNDKGVRVVFARELEELLSRIGRALLGIATEERN